MASFLTDNCYCAGDLTTERLHVNQSLSASSANIHNIEVEHIQTDVVQSDYVYGVEEVGSSHVDALNTLSLHNESINTWQGLIDNEYITIPSPPTPEPDIKYDDAPTFNKLREVNNYSILDVAQSAEDKNILLALMTNDNGNSSVIFYSNNGAVSWSYLFATPHFMTNLSPYFNASSPSTFGLFGQGYVYNYIAYGTHNEMSIAPIDYKNCLKTFPTITETSNSYIISYYQTTGTVCSAWNSLSAHAGCSGCVSGCQVRDKIYNIKNDGTIVMFNITNCVNDSNYETVNALSSSYTWTDIAYIINTDTIICVSSSNKVAIFRHEVADMTIPITVNYSTSSPNTTLNYILPWYGNPLMVTNMNSDWKIMVDDMSDALNPSITFKNIDDDTIPGILFTYHYHPYFNTYTACIGGKGYNITQVNSTKQSVMNALLNIFYPIGTIYSSFSPTNPEIIFGGKWALIKSIFVRGGRKIEYINQIGGNETHNHNYNFRYSINYDSVGAAVHNDHGNKGGMQTYDYNTNQWVTNTAVGSTAANVELPNLNYATSSFWLMESNGNTSYASNEPPFINTFMWRRYA